MSDGMLQQGYLLPFRQYGEEEVINLFALDGTGLNGQFVSYQTGNQTPENADGYSNFSVGAQYTNIVSTRYLNNRRVRVAAATDTKWQVAGVTLHTTAEYDENGNKLVLQSPDQTYERGFVVSGQTVPILKRGLITLRMSQVEGVPFPGYVALITGNGRISAANPATLFTGFYNSVVGRFISTTGSNNYQSTGGYVQLEVQL